MHLQHTYGISDEAVVARWVDRGYRGHDVRGTQVLISGMRRGLTKGLKAQLRRRSAIEPEIGHMKTDGRLARCPLKGTRGDAIFAVLCGCGHTIRKIVARLAFNSGRLDRLRSSLKWLVTEAWTEANF